MVYKDPFVILKQTVVRVYF